jgi:hypothetical protein
MPFFRVVIHGDSIRIESEDNGALGLSFSGEPPIAGFYTTCFVYACDDEAAGKKGMAVVAATWSRPPLSELNRAEPPVLSIDFIERVGIMQGLFGKPRRGHTFYSAVP